MIRPRALAIFVAALIAALLIACGGGGDSVDETATSTDDATPRVTATASDATPNGSATAPSGGTPSAGETPDGNGGANGGNGNGGGTDVPIPTGADDAVQAAKEDIVNNIFEGRTVDEVTLVSIAAKDWPDACLGVPGRGEACAQVITPGYEIVLDLDGAHYFYHTDEGTNVRLANFDLDPSS